MRWTNQWPQNSTKGRSKKSPSLVVERFEGRYYVNGNKQYIDPDTALAYARNCLPKVPLVGVYVRPGVVNMHVRKPSLQYLEASEKLTSPLEAWPLFEAHARMLP